MYNNSNGSLYPPAAGNHAVYHNSLLYVCICCAAIINILSEIFNYFFPIPVIIIVCNRYAAQQIEYTYTFTTFFFAVVFFFSANYLEHMYFPPFWLPEFFC